MAQMIDIQVMKTVLLYILNMWSGTQKRDVYHIVKATFYAQKYHLARYMCPLYPDKIVAMPYGPAPSAMYDALKIARGDARAISFHQNDGLCMVAAPIRFDSEVFYSEEKPDMKYLSPSQIECLDNAINTVGEMSFNEIVSTTHQKEWSRAYNDTSSKEMDMVEIAREEGADEAALEYLKDSLELDDAFARV